MNKADLVDSISKELDIYKSVVDQVVNKLVSIITSEVQKGTKVSIAGLGTFERVLKKGRVGINPSTREQITIAEKNAPKFKVAKGFKDLVAETVF